ncbi:MAG: family acetyltransferase [Streptosporangiaceae bacterium]|jgi:hypothetical protein|nr:family acetyltransferase [Streptosporangiaceae bacterium]
MTDLVIRQLQTGEDELFVSMPEPALVGPAWAGLDYRTVTGRRQYRPEWTWVALRHDRVVAIPLHLDPVMRATRTARPTGVPARP